MVDNSIQNDNIRHGVACITFVLMALSIFTLVYTSESHKFDPEYLPASCNITDIRTIGKVQSPDKILWNVSLIYNEETSCERNAIIYTSPNSRFKKYNIHEIHKCFYKENPNQSCSYSWEIDENTLKIVLFTVALVLLIFCFAICCVCVGGFSK